MHTGTHRNGLKIALPFSFIDSLIEDLQSLVLPFDDTY